MIDNDETNAVSDLRILSLILIDKTLLYLRIFSLSFSEKSHSGPIGGGVIWSDLNARNLDHV